MNISTKISHLPLLMLFLFFITACSGDKSASSDEQASKEHFASEKMETIKKAEAVDQLVQDAAAKQKRAIDEQSR